MDIREIERLCKHESDQAKKLGRQHPPIALAVPVQFTFTMSRAKSEIYRNSDGRSKIRQSAVFLGQGLLARAIDAHEMTKEFLSLKQTENELQKFLDKYGWWDAEAGPSPVDEIWDFQDLLKQARLWPEKTLGKQLSQTCSRSLPGVFATTFQTTVDYSDGAPRFVINTTGCSDAIIASVLGDLARGRRWRKCARDGCDVIFEITSKHDRQYHDRDCQHKALVNRRREEKRKKKAEIRTKIERRR